MNTQKFLEEIQVIENKLQSKANKNKEMERNSVPILIEKLVKENHIEPDLAKTLGELWEYRNKVYSSIHIPEKIPNEVQNMLVEINTKLK